MENIIENEAVKVAEDVVKESVKTGNTNVIIGVVVGVVVVGGCAIAIKKIRNGKKAKDESETSVESDISVDEE